MKEPFVPTSTISQMLPIAMRQEFFRRVFGKQRIYGYKGNYATTTESRWSGTAVVEVIAPWHD